MCSPVKFACCGLLMPVGAEEMSHFLSLKKVFLTVTGSVLFHACALAFQRGREDI